MSVEAFSHVLNNVPLSGNAKVILLGLANHAHPDGTNAYPEMDTLARYAHVDRRTAQRNVRKLEADGWIRNEGFGPHGQTRWAVTMAVSPWGDGKVPRAAQESPGDGNGVPGGMTPVPPEPTTEPLKREEPTSPPARASATDFPKDFPADLRGAHTRTLAILERVATARGAKAPSPVSLARAMMVRADKAPLFELVADRVEHWAVHGRGATRQCRDVVARWRDWLDDEQAPAARNGQPANREDWSAWVDEHLPELEGFQRSRAIQAAQLVKMSRAPVTPEAVQERLDRPLKAVG